jgi:hypothetical protein
MRVLLKALCMWEPVDPLTHSEPDFGHTSSFTAHHPNTCTVVGAMMMLGVSN